MAAQWSYRVPCPKLGHNDIVQHQVAAYGGFEVKSLGDGFMLAFSPARRALQCAMAIQRTFAAPT